MRCVPVPARGFGVNRVLGGSLSTCGGTIAFSNYHTRLGTGRRSTWSQYAIHGHSRTSAMLYGPGSTLIGSTRSGNRRL